MHILTIVGIILTIVTIVVVTMFFISACILSSRCSRIEEQGLFIPVYNPVEDKPIIQIKRIS